MSYNIFTKPVVYMSRICGIYSIDKNLANFTYTIALLIISFAHLIWSPFIIMEIDNTYQNVTTNQESLINFFNLRRLLVATFPASLISTNLCSKLTSLILQEKCLTSICNNFEKVNSVVKPLKTDTKRYKLYSYLSITVFCLLTIPLQLLILYDVFNEAYLSNDVLIWYFLLLFGNISSCCNEVQFIDLCYVLKLRFAQLVHELNSILDVTDSFMLKQINDYLLNNNTELKRTLVNEIKNDSPLHNKRSSFFKNEEKFNVNDISVENKIMYYENLKETIQNMNSINYKQFLTINPNFCVRVKILHTVYRKLSYILYDVGSLYQLQLLMSLSSTFFTILFDLYFMWRSGVRGGKFNQHQSANAFWILHCLVRFLTLVCSAYSTTCEARKAKPLVAAINNRFLDSECKEELLLFSNYMASCKVEFTAYGFFTLNTRLITSAIGAGTTYLVILVQFHSN